MKKLFILFILIYSCKEEKPVAENRNIIADVSVPSKTMEEEKKQKPIEYIYGTDFLLGKFNYKKDSTFTKVSDVHSSKTLYIKKEVYEAFINMYNHAKADNIDLKIISGTRNFYEQKAIWERKWEKYSSLDSIDRALKILEYSSMPSTSRHHWGTDVDLNNLNNSYFETGRGEKEYNWLINHAHTYGFHQVYTSKTNGRKGYNMEKWHWTYLPLSEGYLTFYNKNVKLKDITGFKGADLAYKLNVIEVYVNGISNSLKIE
ncbi:M15 family metallopeptidase [Mangrovimonas sp. DI 80]|uniref:M15 family metallopeptidase n=1 Tax=Mangrovimonas sp. DI 80 TaxID=1779330 RepID=UPI0009784AD5|nr:M15 family metallopeptidase [Mangrovimonas sp. DI 80]OMP29945.1 D-alanyl-D-alanine carboxypeptidase [Mangrovimonas sp. DI 80]